MKLLAGVLLLIVIVVVVNAVLETNARAQQKATLSVVPGFAFRPSVVG